MNTTALVMLILPLIVGGGLLVTLLIMTRIMPGEPKTSKEAPVPAPVPVITREQMLAMAERKGAYGKGTLVFLFLMVATVVELVVALATGAIVPIFLIALVKAALILNYFMHVRTVFAEEAH